MAGSGRRMVGGNARIGALCRPSRGRGAPRVRDAARALSNRVVARGAGGGSPRHSRRRPRFGVFASPTSRANRGPRGPRWRPGASAMPMRSHGASEHWFNRFAPVSLTRAAFKKTSLPPEDARDDGAANCSDRGNRRSPCSAAHGGCARGRGARACFRRALAAYAGRDPRAFPPGGGCVSGLAHCRLAARGRNGARTVWPC